MDRDEQILLLAIRYRLIVRAVVERLFFNGQSCDHILNRLVKEGRLTIIKGAIPGGISCYRVSDAEAARRGLPKQRGAQDKVVRRALAFLYFCCMGNRNRKRLTAKELATLFGEKPLSNRHVLEHDGAETALYRMYLPAPATKVERFAESLREDALDIIEDETLSRWVERRTYRLGIVLESEERVHRLKRALAKREMPDILMCFEAVPPFERMHEHLAAHASRRKSRERDDAPLNRRRPSIEGGSSEPPETP